MWDVFSDLQTQSAASVRQVTGAALNILTTADQVAQDVQGTKRKSPPSVELKEVSSDEEVDINLSYDEFSKLYEAGLVTREQLRRGKVKRKHLEKVKDFMDRENGVVREPSDRTHDLTVGGDLPTSIDCGLKKVDSKRYKRDYVVMRDEPHPQRKWEVQMSPLAHGTEIVKSDTKPVNDTEEEVCINGLVSFIIMSLNL